MELGKNKLKQINSLRKKDQDSYQANLQMGMLLLGNDNVSEAVRYIEKACLARGDNAELCYILANAYKTLGNNDRSGEYFQKALALDPDNYDYLYGYGLFLQSAGNLDRAIELFREASRLRPGNHELHNDIGVLFFQLQRYPDAIESLNQAIEIDPAYALAQVNLGYVHIATGNLLQAKKIVEKLERTNPYDPDFLELKSQFDRKSHELSDSAPDISTDLTFSDQLYSITPLKIIRKFGDKRPEEAIGLSVVIPSTTRWTTSRFCIAS
jgi:Tfp pilus assembly protein PilF